MNSSVAVAEQAFADNHATPRFAEKTRRRYLRRIDSVVGWIEPLTAEAIIAIGEHQVALGIAGAVAEIGVHHGKSFLVLYMTTAEGEKALAIDVFAQQHLNQDGSGRGNREMFVSNVERHAGTKDGLVIAETSSLDISADDVLQRCGRVRLFSIDGAHTEEATMNDIRIAEGSICDEGVVMVDDCYNQAFPEVATAVSKYLYGSHALRPFGVLPNKVLFCRPEYAERYGAFLVERFPMRVDKRARIFGYEVPLLGVLPWTARRRFGRTLLGKRIKRWLGRTKH